MIAAVDAESDLGAQEAVQPSAGIPKGSAYLLTGTSALGAGLIFERGLGFVANLLAARIGGASTFGAYSFAIATANNIGTYAAGGIGATATRFSGKYPRGTSGYSTLARVLLLVSTLSAAFAALILWLGSAPLARMLHQPDLTQLLRWAAFSAAGMILLECGRGFFVGQQRLLGIVSLSVLVGAGMIALLPLMSHLGSTAMVCSQGLVTLSAIAVCLAFYKPLGLQSAVKVSHPKPLPPMLKEVWSFTLVQLAGVIGMNAAGYWLTSLVVQADSSMVQMSFYAIGNQLRNMAALAPSLLSQSSLAVMAEAESDSSANSSPEGSAPGGVLPERVMGICTFVATFASLALAGVGIALAPWALPYLYGNSYAAATAATALSLATAVVHMGNAPAAGRLTIVSIRMTGVINTIWAVAVAAAACLFFVMPGSASLAAAVIFGAHILSAALVLLTLRLKSTVPEGMASLFLLGVGGSTAMAVLSILRTQHPHMASTFSLTLFLIWVSTLTAIFLLGRRSGWIPDLRPAFASLTRRLRVITARTESNDD